MASKLLRTPRRRWARIFAGRKPERLAALGAFSFQGAKIMVTGEGGMLVTNDTELFEQIRLLWDHGRDPHKTFWNNQLGYKYKMSNIQAALGLAQLERIEELVARKREIFSWYQEGLQDCENLQLNTERPGYRNIYWMTSILVKDDSPMNRDEVMAELKKANVDSRPFFHPMSTLPMFEKQNSPTAAAFVAAGNQSAQRPQSDAAANRLRLRSAARHPARLTADAR